METKNYNNKKKENLEFDFHNVEKLIDSLDPNNEVFHKSKVLLKQLKQQIAYEEKER